jgi:hypothetical protein
MEKGKELEERSGLIIYVKDALKKIGSKDLEDVLLRILLIFQLNMKKVSMYLTD